MNAGWNASDVTAARWPTSVHRSGACGKRRYARPSSSAPAAAPLSSARGAVPAAAAAVAAASEAAEAGAVLPPPSRTCTWSAFTRSSRSATRACSATTQSQRCSSAVNGSAAATVAGVSPGGHSGSASRASVRSASAVSSKCRACRYSRIAWSLLVPHTHTQGHILSCADSHTCDMQTSRAAVCPKAAASRRSVGFYQDEKRRETE